MTILKRLATDERGQLSIEYLVLVVFGMMLVVTTGLVVVNLTSLVTVAKAKILTYRDNILSNLM